MFNKFKETIGKIDINKSDKGNEATSTTTTVATWLQVPAESLRPTDKEGYMTKKGLKFKTWKRRLFMLKGDKIWYFGSATDTEAKGCILLTSKTQISIDETQKKKKIYMLLISSKGSNGKDRTFYICAETEQEATEWMEAIQKNVASLPDSGSTADECLSASGAGDNTDLSDMNPKSAPDEMIDDGASSDSGSSSSSSTKGVESTINSSGGWSDMTSPKMHPSNPTINNANNNNNNNAESAALFIQEEIELVKKMHPFIDIDFQTRRLLRSFLENMAPARQSQLQFQQQPQPTTLWIVDADDGNPVPSTSGPAGSAVVVSRDEVELCVMGGRAELAHGIADFFKKEGVPGMDTDRFVHACDLLDPQSLCAWLRMVGGSAGEWRSECGWRLSNIKNGGFVGAASCLADPSHDTTDSIVAWLEGHGMRDVAFAGKSTKDAPRRTEICVTLPGSTLDERIAVAQEAVEKFAPEKKKKKAEENKENDVEGKEKEEETKRGENKESSGEEKKEDTHLSPDAWVWDELRTTSSPDTPLYFVIEFSCMKIVQVSIAAERKHAVATTTTLLKEIEKEKEIENIEESKCEVESRYTMYSMYKWVDGQEKPVKVRCRKLCTKKAT